MEKESERLEQWASDRLQELRDGDNVVTQGGDISCAEVPQWYDEKLFKKAKEVHRENFASVHFSHLCGLFIGFSFTKNVKPLLFTGESENKYKVFHRYLATIRHVQKWYEGDVWDSKDPAHKSLAAVQSMHTRVRDKMANLKDGIVYLSQWDMAVTQWCFVGPMVIFRSKVGLHTLNEEEYESLIHFWRVIGYLLGIEDRYNLCTGEYEQIVALCNSFLEKECKERMVIADPISVNMGKTVGAGMHMIDILVTWGSISNYIHELVGVPCPNRMNYIDWIYNLLLKFIMTFVLQFRFLRSLCNDVNRWRLDVAEKRDLEFKQSKKYILPPCIIK